MPAYRWIFKTSLNHDREALGHREGSRAPSSPRTSVADAVKKGVGTYPSGRSTPEGNGDRMSRVPGSELCHSTRRAVARPFSTSNNTVRPRRPLRLIRTTVPSGAFALLGEDVRAKCRLEAIDHDLFSGAVIVPRLEQARREYLADESNCRALASLGSGDRDAPLRGSSPPSPTPRRSVHAVVRWSLSTRHGERVQEFVARSRFDTPLRTLR
jgi:hypothetical protein